MDKVRKSDGSFTVFFAMAFLSILVFYFILIYAANHCITVTQGRKMVNSAARSALAEYDQHIEKKYGIYAMTSPIQARENFEYYLRENTENYKGGALFPYKLIQVKLEGAKDLSQTSVVAGQIKQFMKERILLDVFDQITESLGVLQTSAQTVEKTVTNLDQLQEYNELYQQLVEKIDGIRSDGSSTGKGINAVRVDERIKEFLLKMEAAIERKEIGTFKSAAKEWRMEIQNDREIYSEMEQILVKMQGIGKNLAEETLPLTMTEITEHRQYIRMIKEKFGVLEEKIKNWEERPYEEIIMQQVKEAGEDLQEQWHKISLDYTVRDGEMLSLDIKKLWKEITRKTEKDIWDCAPNQDLLSVGDPEYFQLPSKIYHEEEGIEESEEFEDVLAEILAKFKEAGLAIVEKFYLVEYAGGMLQSFPEAVQRQEGTSSLNLRREAKAPGFFSNELEYLIRGSFNEYKNVRSVQRRIVGVRTVLNMISIYNDQTKTQLIKDLADSIGGLTSSKAGQVVTYAVLWVGWSLWEAKEDWNELVEGGNVPLLKAKEEWKTDLEGPFDEASEEPDRGGKEGRGLSYQQYAKFLLCLSSADTIEKRIQDLIYLENDGRIPLQWYLTEFSAEGSIQVGGKIYAFSGTYQY